jgi:hypothetical protein
MRAGNVHAVCSPLKLSDPCVCRGSGSSSTYDLPCSRNRSLTCLPIRDEYSSFFPQPATQLSPTPPEGLQVSAILPMIFFG